MAYSVNQKTLVATYNGKKFSPMCSNGVHRALTEIECLEFKTDIDAWVSKEFDRALNSLREKRNNLLTNTDWWGASDNTMTDAQKKYRQDLRDLTAGLDTVEKVNAVVWPTKP
jgi:alpha-L-fucosidase